MNEKEKRIEIPDAIQILQARITSICIHLDQLTLPEAPAPRSPEVLRTEQSKTNRIGIHAAVHGTQFERPGQIAMELKGLQEVPRALPKRDSHKKEKTEVAAKLQDAAWRSVIAMCDELGTRTSWKDKLRQDRCRVLSAELKAKYNLQKTSSSLFSPGYRPTPNDFEMACHQLLTEEQRVLIKSDDLVKSIEDLKPEIAKMGRLLHLPRRIA